jgi:hypothetical protein
MLTLILTAYRHVKQVVSDTRRDYDLADLLSPRREDSYQQHLQGVRCCCVEGVCTTAKWREAVTFGAVQSYSKCILWHALPPLIVLVVALQIRYGSLT